MWEWLKRSLERLFTDLYEFLSDLLVSLLIGVRSVFKFFYEKIYAVYEYCVKVISLTYTYIKDTAKSLWNKAWEQIQGYWDALWEQYKEWCNWVIDTAAWLFDYVVSWGFDMLLWVIDQLPGLEGQEGFKEGMKEFLLLVAAVNKFMPVSEMVMMTGLFVTIYTIVVSYRFAKQWIPTISN